MTHEEHANVITQDLMWVCISTIALIVICLTLKIPGLLWLKVIGISCNSVSIIANGISYISYRRRTK